MNKDNDVFATTTPATHQPITEQSYVYVSVKGKNHSSIEAVFTDENIAMIKKCKECIVLKYPVDETKFIS